MSDVVDLRGSRLVVASHNAGKVREIRVLLEPFGVETVSAGDLGLDAPEETETTFEGNALIKARETAAAAGLPALADDSGLAIDALDGAPGVYTADWAETESGRDFGLAMARAHRELTARGAAEPWTGQFVSVLAIAWPAADGGAERTFRGEIGGRLVWPPRGENGFGYDPMFIRDGETRTFGELSFEEKYADNHRTRAFAALVAALFPDP